MKRTAAIPDTRNRRISTPKQRKQQHLLDVKVRSRKAAQQRVGRMISLACKLILFVGILSGLYLGVEEGLRRFLWENPYYALADVEVKADGTLTKEQVMHAAGIFEGANIFAVNLSRARADLTNLPQVSEVEIRRVLPNRIIMHVFERKPVAWLTPSGIDDPSTSDKSFLIDGNGVLISPKVRLPEYVNLPVISGQDIESLKAGQTVEEPELKGALALVKLNSDSPRFAFQNIDVSKKYCLTATDRNHARITFGLEQPIEGQLARLETLIQHVEESDRELQTVNLMVERNVPVTFVEPPPPEVEIAPAKTKSAAEGRSAMAFRTGSSSNNHDRANSPAQNSPPVAQPATSPLIKPFNIAGDGPKTSRSAPKKKTSSASSRKGGPRR